MLYKELNTINTLFYENSSALKGFISKGTELLKVFKTKSLKKFTQRDIEKYLLYLKRRGNKNSTINAKLAYLSKCLKYHGVTLIIPYQTVKPKHKDIIPADNFTELLKTASEIIEPNKLNELIQFLNIAYYTGLRASEVLKLNRLHIKKQDDIYFLSIYDTKNHTSNLIPVNKKLNKTLDNFQEFTLNYKQLYYELKKLGITAHQFRHSFITRSFENGLSAFTVMRLVNQTSINSTKQYVHLQNKFLADAVQNTS